MRTSPAPRSNVSRHRKRDVTRRRKPGPPSEAPDAIQVVRQNPPVLIEIDPAVPGGHVDNRFDIMIRGRAVSTVRVDEIRLQVADRVNSATFLGHPEHETVCVMADGSLAKQLVFQFNLPRPGDGQAEHCKFQIVAHTEQGVEHVVDFELEATCGEILAVSGPTCPVVAFGGAQPHAIMYVELATISPAGVLFVRGWAASFARVVSVEIWLEEKRLGDASLGEERADVAVVHPAYPNARLSGFSLTTQLDRLGRSGRVVRARLVCLDGFGHEEVIPVNHLESQDGHPLDLLPAPSASAAGLGRSIRPGSKSTAMRRS